MKSALSLTLIASLMGSMLPVAAEESTPAVGPIGRSIAREAARLAGVQEIQRPPSDWSHLYTIAPGSEVLVTSRGSIPAKRVFLQADQSHIAVLNLAGVILKAEERRALQDAVGQHPDSFVGAGSVGPFVSGSVRIDQGSIFVAARKVGEVTQVVESIQQTDLLEVSVARWAHPVALGALIGAATALVISVANYHCGSECYVGPLTALTVGIGAGAGAGIGAIIEARRRDAVHVIYRAP